MALRVETERWLRMEIVASLERARKSLKPEPMRPRADTEVVIRLAFPDSNVREMQAAFNKIIRDVRP